LLRTVGDQAQSPIIALGPIAVGPEGRVFIGETDLDRIRVFGADGADLGMVTVPSPTDITIRDDTMAVGSIAGFAILDPETGTPLSTVGTRGPGPDQFDTVGGVAIAPDGTRFAVDTFNNRVVAINEDGERLWTTQTGHPGNAVSVTGAAEMNASRITTAPAALQLPADVTVDGNGRVVVIDSFDFSIAVFDPATGEFLAKYGAFGNQDGQFRYPTSISYDPARDWFVIADTGNARVQIVRIPGSAPFELGATARRSLSGPVRACAAPLALLLILLVLFIVQRVRRRRERKRLESATQVSTATEV